LWRAAVDPRGTLVEHHLESHGLDLPDEAAGEVIRFHPNYPFIAERFPAMICLVRNAVTNKPQAIHRTALAPSGTAIKRNGKTFRMSLGPVSGGGIKIDPDDGVTHSLCIGEGVETCLSGRQMGLRPVWSLVSVSGVANFPVLPSIEGLHIFAENDANGASGKPVEACARRWYEAGRVVIIVEPDTAKDLNDGISKRDAARRRFRQSIEYRHHRDWSLDQRHRRQGPAGTHQWERRVWRVAAPRHGRREERGRWRRR
jgi:putative DNA primase/helicase